MVVVNKTKVGVLPHEVHQLINNNVNISAICLNVDYDGISNLNIGFENELTASEDTELENLLSGYVMTVPKLPISNFKIGAYADSNYETQPFNVFDFKSMLRIDVATSKKTYMLPNGRPQRSDYYIEDVLVATIYFIFETSTDNVIERRKEELAYLDLNDAESERILIKDKSYNGSDQLINDGSLIMAERVSARTSIIEGMKANLAGIIMMALQKNLADTVVVIRPFWEEQASIRRDFVELGDSSWKDTLIAMDLLATPHTWLGIDLGGGFTVRDFMVSKISY